VLDVTITPLEVQVAGTHLMLEFADATQRQSTFRANDLITPPDGFPCG